MISITSEKYSSILKAVDYFQQNKISITKCAKMFNIHRETLAKYLKEYDLHEDRRQYKVNENYFETIDTESKAYWLGFITADGCLKTDINQLSIGLSRNDINHLEKLKHDISSEHPINLETATINGKVYETCSIRIGNKKMYNDLKKLGIESNKSLHEIPAELPNNLIKDYIRGIFDGDGWLSWNSNCAEIGFGMGYDILNYIKENAEALAKVKEYQIKPYKSIYRYRITSNVEIKKLLDYMYIDSTIYLNRKYEKYLDYCRSKTKLQKS